MASAGCRPETNALFLAGRTLADLPGSWQAQTSLQAEPLAGDKRKPAISTAIGWRRCR